MADPTINTTESQLVEIIQSVLGEQGVKAWTSSKTLGLAALTIILGVTTALGWTPVPDQEIAGGVVTIIGAAFAILRTLTRQPLG